LALSCGRQPAADLFGEQTTGAISSPAASVAWCNARCCVRTAMSRLLQRRSASAAPRSPQAEAVRAAAGALSRRSRLVARDLIVVLDTRRTSVNNCRVIEGTSTMKITIEISDELYRKAKAEAALRGRKLRDMVEEGLGLVLEAPLNARLPTLAGLTKRARGIIDSGVADLGSNPAHLAGFGRDDRRER
jgi:hypothetical protein